MMPRFYPPGSLSEHVVTMHGFPIGKTVTDHVHLADHASHDRAVDWLRSDQWQWGRLSAVLPIRHAYARIVEPVELEEEVRAAA
jgi:hypothetical protein